MDIKGNLPSSNEVPPFKVLYQWLRRCQTDQICWMEFRPWPTLGRSVLDTPGGGSVNGCDCDSGLFESGYYSGKRGPDFARKAEA